MKRSFALLLALCSPLLLAASCGEKADPTLQQDQGSFGEIQPDSMSETSGEAALLAALTEAPVDSATEEDAANTAANGASSTYGSCLTSTVEGNVATYDLQDCAGPWGFLTITGAVEVTYSLVAGGILRGEVEATGLEVNNGTADLIATVDRTIIDDGTRFNVNTNWVGRTSLDKVTSRVGTYVSVIDADDECISLDGTWVSTAGLTSWDTAVESFSVCRGQCPDAGGTATWTARDGREFVLEYDGSSTATWSKTDGESDEISLACGRV